MSVDFSDSDSFNDDQIEVSKASSVSLIDNIQFSDDEENIEMPSLGKHKR